MPEKQKPLWLLDVDGVINAVCGGTPSSKLSGWDDWKTFKAANGFRIWFSPTLLNFIAEVHLSGRADVRWLTTWEEEANEQLIETLAIPKLQLLGARNDGWKYFSDFNWWKFQLAKKLVPNGVPLIWTDDDLGYASGLNEDGISEWLDKRGPTLPLSPNPYIGISRSQMLQIDEFLNSLV